MDTIAKANMSKLRRVETKAQLATERKRMPTKVQEQFIRYGIIKRYLAITVDDITLASEIGDETGFDLCVSALSARGKQAYQLYTVCFGGDEPIFVGSVFGMTYRDNQSWVTTEFPFWYHPRKGLYIGTKPFK